MTSPKTLLRAKFGDFVVDFDSFELRKHGIRLKLQRQPFLVLKLLLQHAGQVVTREQLCAELWAGTTFVDFDAGLNAAIRRLRDVLCDSADQSRYIETLPRLGYRFVAPLEIVAESPLTVQPVQVVEEVKAEVSSADTSIPIEPLPLRSRWIRSLLPACVIIATIGLGMFALRSTVLARRPGNGGTYSIAVLPLQNLSGDPAEDYFADGITDALITDLAQSNALRVISSTSSMRYRDVHKALPEIARELNVGFILEGSVFRSGNHVRVSAQLVDAARDQHLWARQYDRDLQDVLRLQSELASSVALEVTGKLSSSEQRGSPATVPRVNPDSYEAYLKGRYFLDKWSEEGLDKAKGYFERAVELDPNFADAHVGLAEYYGTVAFKGSAPPQEAWLKAEEILAQTLPMDPRSAKLHTLLGMIKLQFRCDPVGAEKELDYALQLNPADTYALDFHSYYLLEIGRTEQAIAEKQRVLEHDPLSVRTNAELALYLLHAQRNDEAIVRLQKTLELDPTYAAAHMRLGFAYENKKQYELAEAEMQKAIALDKQPARLAGLGELYVLWGKREQALQTIAQLKRVAKQRYVPPNTIAAVYARLGDKVDALDWLKKAKPEDDMDISDPIFDSLRPDPEFKVIAARLKPKQSCPPF